MLKRFGTYKITFLAVLVLAALLGGREVIGQVPDQKLKEKIQAYNSDPKVPTLDPTQIAEKDARQQATIRQSKEAYAQWLEEFKNSGVNPVSLAWSELGGFYAPGPNSIDEAVREAKLIAKGMATRVEFRVVGSSPQSVVTFRVDEVLAGQAEASIRLIFGGAPIPGPDTKNLADARIGYYAVEPLLLPGEEAILLLRQHHIEPDAYSGLAWTGINRIQGGVVKANIVEGESISSLAHSTLRTLFNGRPAAEVVELLKAAIAKN
jgi:hypothetical protein